MSMTRRRKILLIVAGIAILITIVRETGLFNINWYSSNINATTTSNWTDNKGVCDLPPRIAGANPYPDSCNYPSLANVPIQVWVDNYLVGDTVECPQVGAFYHDITYGFLYTPLYKSAHFSAAVPVSSSLTFYTPHDTLIHTESLSLSGMITINGDITITGLCSARKAREIVREYVAEELYRQIAAHTGHP